MATVGLQAARGAMRQWLVCAALGLYLLKGHANEIEGRFALCPGHKGVLADRTPNGIQGGFHIHQGLDLRVALALLAEARLGKAAGERLEDRQLGEHLRKRLGREGVIGCVHVKEHCRSEWGLGLGVSVGVGEGRGNVGKKAKDEPPKRATSSDLQMRPRPRKSSLRSRSPSFFVSNTAKRPVEEGKWRQERWQKRRRRGGACA